MITKRYAMFRLEDGSFDLYEKRQRQANVDFGTRYEDIQTRSDLIKVSGPAEIENALFLGSRPEECIAVAYLDTDESLDGNFFIVSYKTAKDSEGVIGLRTRQAGLIAIETFFVCQSQSMTDSRPICSRTRSGHDGRAYQADLIGSVDLIMSYLEGFATLRAQTPFVYLYSPYFSNGMNSTKLTEIAVPKAIMPAARMTVKQADGESFENENPFLCQMDFGAKSSVRIEFEYMGAEDVFSLYSQLRAAGASVSLGDPECEAEIFRMMIGA